MASVVYNQFKKYIADGTIDLDTNNIWAALVMTNTTVDTQNDGIEHIDDFTTLDECDGANYVRKALASKAVNLDDGNDRAEFDADNVTWSALGNGTRAVQGVLIYVDTDNDGDSADDESMDLLKQLAKRMIFIEQQIRLNKDIPSQHLRWVDGEYRKLYNEKMEKEL